jgi:hypothetical protein
MATTGPGLHAGDRVRECVGSPTMKDLTSVIRLVIDGHGKLPSANWLAMTAKVSTEEAQQALDAYQVQEAPFQTVKEAPTVAPELEPVKHPHSLPVQALRIIAGVLAGAAIIRAVFYALGWFGGESDWLAWLMAILVVGVTVLMPQMAVILWRNGNRGLSVLAGVLTVIVMAFSMLLTVGGIYNSRTDRANADAVVQAEAVKAGERMADLVKRETALMSSIQSAVLEQDRIQRQLDGLAVDAPGYWSVQNRLDRQVKRIDTLRGDLLNLGKEKASLDALVTPRQDFFQWLGEFLGIGADGVEFWAAVTPALIIDVAAPVLLFVVFFL